MTRSARKSGEEERQDWHARPASEALAALESAPEGLDARDAEIRRARFGPNRLPAPPRRGPLLRFLLQFHNVLIYVLLFAAGVTAFLEHPTDTIVILAVVIVNALIGFIQEGKAEKAMEAIREMLSPRAAVLRGGERLSVPGEDLVPGDIVLLEAGDKVPADLRLLGARGLMVQEAILTGESVPSEKRIEPVEASAQIGDRACMAFSGTLVTAGQGKGVVTATGALTEIGRIGALLGAVETLTTPLIARMESFARYLTGFILCVAALLLAFGYFLGGHEFSELLMIVVGLSVAAIPEGLPAVLTVTMAIGVQAMARRNAIVRRLPAIETLGSVSVICTDKTGTLTRNEMIVANAVVSGREVSVSGIGYDPAGEVREEAGALVEGDPALRALGLAAALCNDAALREGDSGWSVEGDPMEGALLSFAEKTGVRIKETLRGWTRTDVIPFDSRHRFMATLCHDHEGRARIFVKGAPERLLPMCAERQSAEQWHEKAEALAARGQRVLALATREVKPSHTVLEIADVEGNLTLLGLVGMIDPPRPEAVSAIAECRGAGIRVKMITGDHAGTACAIGRTIGLENPDRVLTGRDIDGLDDAALAQAALETDIFARTSPEHKLRLVTALQSRGLTVAMTGDGVNDAPALRRADAGVAMGRKGSAAAREASEIVLADDNFASIVAAVREGRTVYDNIRKVIGWTLPTNAGEAMVIVFALVSGMSMPITPIQILWVNLVTATTLGVALAFEPSERNVMRHPPRRREEPLLDGIMLWQVVLVSILFVLGMLFVQGFGIHRGYEDEAVRTLVLNALVAMEIFYLFFMRNLRESSLALNALKGTRAVWATVLILVAAQAAVTYLRPLQDVFGTQDLSFPDLLLVGAVGVALFALLEVEKRLRLRILRRG